MPRNRVQHQKGLSDDAFERLYPDEAGLAKGLVIAVTETASDGDVDALEAALKELCQ